METNNNGTDFGGSRSRKMKLKSLKTRDDMSGVDHEEDYHTGVPASVPFVWESEPGTPKNKDKEKEKKDKFDDDGGVVSPLTPPPSYFSPSPRHRHSRPLSLRNNSKSSSRTNFLNNVFRKLSVKAASLQPPSLPSSSSSSSSSSLSSSTMTTPTSSRRERGRRLSFEWKLDDQEEEEEEEEETNNEESPVSTLFFGRRVNGQGCCPKLVKVFSRDVN